MEADMTGWRSKGWVSEMNINHTAWKTKYITRGKDKKGRGVYLRNNKLHHCSYLGMAGNPSSTN